MWHLLENHFIYEFCNQSPPRHPGITDSIIPILVNKSPVTAQMYLLGRSIPLCEFTFQTEQCSQISRRHKQKWIFTPALNRSGVDPLATGTGQEKGNVALTALVIQMLGKLLFSRGFFVCLFVCVCYRMLVLIILKISINHPIYVGFFCLFFSLALCNLFWDWPYRSTF